MREKYSGGVKKKNDISNFRRILRNGERRKRKRRRRRSRRCLLLLKDDDSIRKVCWSVVMNNVHICSGRPISNCYPLGPATSFCLTLLLTLKTISTPSLLSRSISLHIKLWSSEWPIVACCCCCCDIFGYIKFFFPPEKRVYVQAESIYTVCPLPTTSTRP